MTFFIHQQAIAALQFLYPTLKNNVDYIVLMEVDNTKPVTGEGSPPLADCFIAEWRTTAYPQPTIEYLKQIFSDNNLNAKILATAAPASAQPATTGTVTA